MQTHTHITEAETFSFATWWADFSAQYAVQTQLSDICLSAFHALNDAHPVLRQGAEMATVLADLSAGPEALLAALLYPVIEAEVLSLETLRQQHAGIASIIVGARNMVAVQGLRKSKKTAAYHQQIDRLRKMLIAMVNDVRVALVKLAERIYVLRHADTQCSAAAQKVLAYEIMNIYAPLANRLGIGQLKWELEDRAFRYLQRDTYKHISQSLQDKRQEREAYIEQMIEQLTAVLQAKRIRVEVNGRIKHIYSIWRKMQKKQLSFEQLYDVRALRVLVRDVHSCYQALSAIQAVWPSLPSEFDDYIATPKPNGYSSIHLVIQGPEDKTIEIQIRTYAMHEASEMGVAAHWRYKEGVVRDAGFEARLEWLRSLLDWQKELSQGDEHIEAIRTEVVDSQIYVFTPLGEVLDLPIGSTPLDFAYHVHTEVGHRCRGAKVDGKMVPLTTPLQTGQRVEIMTTKAGQPSRDWLRADAGYLASSRARQKVQHWFRQLNKAENAAAGKEILLKALKRLSVNKVDYLAVAREFNVHDAEDLYAAIATGDTKLYSVVAYIEKHFSKSLLADNKTAAPTEPDVADMATTPTRRQTTQTDLVINEVGNLLFHMAGCCHPIHGDDVIGYITQGRGVTVHRQDCPTITALAETRAERIVDVQWGDQHENAFVADLLLYVDTSATVRQVAQLLSQEDIDLVGLTTQRGKSQTSVRLRIQVPDRAQLQRIAVKLSQLKGVLAVKR